MADRTINTELKLSGEREYKEACSNITDALKNINSEIAVVTAEFGKNTTSIEGLTAKQTVLHSRYDEQKNKIEAAQKAYATYIEAGLLPSDAAMQQLTRDINYYQAALIKTDKEIQENEKALAANTDTSKNYIKTVSEIDKTMSVLNAELKTVMTSFGDNANSVEALKMKSESLSKIQDEQTKKVRELSAAYESSVKESSAMSDGSVKLKLELEKAKQEAASTGDQFKKTEEALRDAAGASEETATGIQDLGKAEDETKEKTSIFGDVLKASLAADAIKASISFIVDGIKSITAAVTDYISSGKQMADASAQNQAKLTQVMKNTMEASEAEIKSIVELTQAQEKLGVVSATAQIGGAQELSTYLSKKETLEKLIPTMNDMIAQQFGVNASQESAVSIATMLGKVMDGQVGALSRYGYTFDEAQEKILKFGTEEERAAVLAEVVGASVGGMNEALGQIDAGKMVRFNAVAEQTQERVGEIANTFKAKILGEMLPAVESISDAFLNLLNGEGSAEEMSNAMESVIDSAIDVIENTLPEIIELGVNVISALVKGISDNIDKIVDGAEKIITQLTGAVIELLPEIVDAGVKVIISLVEGIADMLPELIPVAIDAILTIVDTLLNNADELIDAGLALIISLNEGLIDSLPVLLEKLPEIIQKIVDAIIYLTPEMIKASFEIVTKLVSGIIDNLPQIGAAAGKIINELINGFAALIDNIVNIGFDIVKGIWNGITGNGDWLSEKGKGFLESFGKGLLGEASSAGAKVGNAFVDGVGDGVTKSGGGFGGKLVDGEWVRSFSEREENLFKGIGEELPKALADGIDENSDAVTDAMEKMTKEEYDQAILVIKDYRNQADYLIEGEIAMWEELSKSFSELSKEKVEIGNNITRLRKEQLQQQGKEEKEALKTEQDIQKYREKAASDAAKSREKAEKEAIQAIEKAEKDFYEQQKLLISDYKNNVEYTVAGELALWEELAKNYDALSKEKIEIDKNISKLQQQIAEENKKAFDASVKETVAVLKEQYKEASEVEQYMLDRQVQAVKTATDEKVAEYNREYDEKIKLIDEASQAEIKALQSQLAALDGDSSSDKTYENTKKLIDLNQAIVQARMGNGDLAKALEAYDNEVARQEKEKKAAQIQSEKELLTAQIKGIEEAAKLKIQLTKEERDRTKAALDEEIAYRQEIADREVEISGTKNEQLKQLMQEDLDEFIRIHNEKAAVASSDDSSIQFEQMIEELQLKLGEATSDAEKARLQKQLDELQDFREEFFNNITLSAQQTEALLSQAQEEINHIQMKALKKQHYAEINSEENLQAEARRQLLQENEETALSILSEYDENWKQQSKNHIENINEGAKEGITALTDSINEAVKNLDTVKYTGISEALRKDLTEAETYIPKYRSLGATLSEAFKTGISTIQSIVSDIITGIAETVSSGMNATVETIRTKNDEIIQLFDEYKPKWFDAGAALVDKFTEGADFQKFINKVKSEIAKAAAMISGDENSGGSDPSLVPHTLNGVEGELHYAPGSHPVFYAGGKASYEADSARRAKIADSLIINFNKPVESAAETARALKNTLKDAADALN